MKGCRVQNISWNEIELILKRNALAALPIGAGSKEHGYHLPMGTDFLQAEWLVDQLIAQLDILVWPTVSYGYYPAFVEYSGTVSLAEETFQQLTTQILEDMKRAGAARIVILNTGISTIMPLTHVVETIQGAMVKLINVYHGKQATAARAQLQEQQFGSHADELETSIMLNVAPNLVNMSKATANADIEFVKGPLNRFNPDKANFTPSGVYGDATLATKRKGEVILMAILQDIIKQIKEWQIHS